MWASPKYLSTARIWHPCALYTLNSPFSECFGGPHFMGCRTSICIQVVVLVQVGQSVTVPMLWVLRGMRNPQPAQNEGPGLRVGVDNSRRVEGS